MSTAFGPHTSSAGELAERLAADRRGRPYLALRDGEGRQLLVELRGERMSLGRGSGSDVALAWDPEVSRVHALLERLGDHWTVVDDGVSRNGTYVDGERLTGRRLLGDGCVLRVGATEVLFRDPGERAAETAPARGGPELTRLTPTQRRVLVALCRPMAGPDAGPAAASNREIAGEVHLSVEGVRSQLKALFALLGVPELPQGRKRAELARRALAAGHVTERDLHA